MKNSYRIAVSGNKIVTVNVPVIFFQLKGQKTVFAECPSLGIVTEGKNLSHAKEMFNEALQCWVEGMNECSDISEALKELGWKVSKRNIIPSTTMSNREPVRVLGMNSQAISIPLFGVC